MTEVRRALRPCANCPWRRDAAPGEFPASRYEALTATSGSPGNEVPIGAPLFACHKTAEGKEIACAGWLAAVGRYHLGMRVAVLDGRLDPAAFDPGPDWPELYGSYAEMATVNGHTPRPREETSCSAPWPASWP